MPKKTYRPEEIIVELRERPRLMSRRPTSHE
jgi:hypothetical protein